MKVNELWVLRTPGGKLIARTAAVNRWEAQSNAVNWLDVNPPLAWIPGYASGWEASLRLMRKLGYRVVKGSLRND